MPKLTIDDDQRAVLSLLARSLPPGAECGLLLPDDRLPSFVATLGDAIASSRTLPNEVAVGVGDAGTLHAIAGEGEAAPVLWAYVPSSGTVSDEETATCLTQAHGVLTTCRALSSELDDMAEELIDRYEEINFLYETKDQFARLTGGDDALEQVVDSCSDYFYSRMIVLILRDENIVIQRAGTGMAEMDLDRLVRCIDTHAYDQVVTGKEALTFSGAMPSDDGSGPECRVLAAPIQDGGEKAAGILALASPAESPKFTNSDKNLLMVMSRKIADMLQVVFDRLTGLRNHDSFCSALEHAIEDSHRRDVEHCLLYVDMDKLQIINETLSRQIGDACLVNAAKTLRNSVRSDDLVGRLGGDEFGVLLRNCDAVKGEEIANKIRQSISDLPIPAGVELRSCTACVVVVPINAGLVSPAKVLSMAEILTLDVKRKGRNRTLNLLSADTSQLMRRHREISYASRVEEALREDRFPAFRPTHCAPERRKGRIRRDTHSIVGRRWAAYPTAGVLIGSRTLPSHVQGGSMGSEYGVGDDSQYSEDAARIDQSIRSEHQRSPVLGFPRCRGQGQPHSEG